MPRVDAPWQRHTQVGGDVAQSQAVAVRLALVAEAASIHLRTACLFERAGVTVGPAVQRSWWARWITVSLSSRFRSAG